MAFSKIRQTFQSGGERVAGWLMMEGGSRVVRWQDEVKMENLDQFVMETAPQVSPLIIMMMAMMERGCQQVKMNCSSTIPIAIIVI